MRNCIILGSGRSGTSMVAGGLAKAGYFMGDSLLPARDANPKGFFEDQEVNEINELILDDVVPKRLRFLGVEFFCDRPLHGHRWLARIPVGEIIPPPLPVQDRIQRLLRREPYCLKDPRFSYTLHVWRPLIGNAVFVCVFRDPGSTAESIIMECKGHNYNLRISLEQAVEVWSLMYRHILEIHSCHGEWLFLHYNQVLSPEGLDRLESFTGTTVDRSFPDPSLRRSSSKHPVSSGVREIYRQLCALAEYEA